MSNEVKSVEVSSFISIGGIDEEISEFLPIGKRSTFNSLIEPVESGRLSNKSYVSMLMAPHDFAGTFFFCENVHERMQRNIENFVSWVYKYKKVGSQKPAI